MTKRLVLTLAMAVTVLLLGATAASAKAPTTAAISGPGLDFPLTVREADGVEIWSETDPVRLLCEATGICDGPTVKPAEAPKGELGAPYTVDFGAFGTAYVHLDPAGGPWVRRTFPGQTNDRDDWIQASPTLAALLRSHGVPPQREPTPAASAPAPAPVAAESRPSSMPEIVTAGTTAIVLAALGIVILRRRRLG